MPQVKVLLSAALAVAAVSLSVCLALPSDSFQGSLVADGINVRADSTVSAAVICQVGRIDIVEVVAELYDWYKIRLPLRAHLFLKKDFVEPSDAKTAKVAHDRVNIRLEPSESAAVVGKADTGEIIDIRGESGDWYKIGPTYNCYGWVHKKFVRKLSAVKKENKVSLYAPQLQEDENLVTWEGIIRPKVIKGIATHKLIAADTRVFLLMGPKKSLDLLNHRRAKVVGSLEAGARSGYPLIEVKSLEGLD